MPVKTDCVIRVKCPCGYHASVHFAPASVYCQSTEYICSGLCGRVYTIIDYMKGITIYFLKERIMNITIGGKTKEVTDEQMKQIEKLLESELRTPDNIKFCAGTWDEYVYGLFFNNNRQILGYSTTGHWNVTVRTDQILRNNRKLFPVKREDLKPGDFAYRDVVPDADFDFKEGYGIILDSEMVVEVIDGREIHEDCQDYPYWWKVV